MLCHRKIPNLNISLYSFNLRWKDNRWDIKCSAPIQNSTIWDKRVTLDKKKRAESFFLKNQRTSKLQPNNVFAQINQTRTHKSYKRIKQISRLQQTYALRSFQHWRTIPKTYNRKVLRPRPITSKPRREGNYMEGCLPVEEQRMGRRRASTSSSHHSITNELPPSKIYSASLVLLKPTVEKPKCFQKNSQ